ATKVPSAFLGDCFSHIAITSVTWTRARPANDFSAVQSQLEKTLDYSRQYANYFPNYEHIADPLIDATDYGMKANSVRAVFADLRAQLAPIAEAITSQSPADTSVLPKLYPEQQHWDFGLDRTKRLRYH